MDGPSASAVALVTALGLITVLGTSCGSAPARAPGIALPAASGTVRGPALIPVTVGPGPRYRPRAAARSVPGAGPCGRLGRVAYGVHLELFAAGRVVVVPAGIGVRPPLVVDGARVRGGRCALRLRTLEPTGLVAVAAGARTPTLGVLFGIWGQPLSSGRMAGFRFAGAVAAWVNGMRWRGDAARIPLRRHVQIVVEVGRPRLPPHPRYGFPPGY